MSAPGELERRVAELLEVNAQLKIHAPDFGADSQWLNTSRRLTLRGDLAGKVVLIDFWTYCCINCMHVLADLEHLERRFAGRAFAVVGCHSAKFANEADTGHVRAAVLRENIEHPVVVDEDFDIWQRYAVRAWPTLVLVSPDGLVLAQVSGEGQRAVLEALIERTLAKYADALDPRPLPLRLERDAELARELAFPGKLAVREDARELWISDTNHDRVVVATLAGEFVRTIGSGERGFADGAADAARFDRPQGLAFGPDALYVADTGNHAIRRVDLESGAVTTLAGTGRQGYTRSGAFAAREAALNSPWDLALRGDELWIAMAGPHQIWKLALRDGTITPAFGDGSERKLDGAAGTAGFAQPSGLARVDELLYVADSESSSIRVIDLDRGRVSTLAGGDANPANLFHFGDEDGPGAGRRFQHPLGVCAHDGVLYVADTFNHKVKFVDRSSGRVTTFAGTGAAGYADGPVESARFAEPGGLAASGDTLFVADTNNHRVRAIDLVQHEVRTLALAGVPIPRAAWSRASARTLDGAPLPEVAGTVDHGLVAAELKNGEAVLELRPALRTGETLAPGAPSQYRVLHDFGLTAARSIAGELRAPATEVALGVLGSGRLAVQVLYYVCGADGACRMRAGRWTLAVTAADDGAARCVLDDAQGRTGA